MENEDITLITGATGLLGNNVVRLLCDQNRPVRVLVRSSSDARPLEGLAVERTMGELTDRPSLEKAFAGVSQVIHAAAHIHIGWRELDTARRVNVDGTRCLAEVARQRGVRMVYVSTVDTLGTGTPDQPATEQSPRDGKVPCTYVISKREAEASIHAMVEEGLQAVLVNPSFMLGPWDWKPSSGRMLVAVARQAPLAAPSGGSSLADARDVAAGVLAALEKGQVGRNYILAGENLTYFHLWSLFAEIAGKRKPTFRFGPFVPYLSGYAGDAWARLTGREPAINTAAVRMSRQFHCYDSSRAAHELGYQFRPAREAVEAAWQWFCDYGYVKS